MSKSHDIKIETFKKKVNKDRVEELLEEIGFQGRNGSVRKGRHHIKIKRNHHSLVLKIHKDIDKYGGYGRYEPHVAVPPDDRVLDKIYSIMEREDIAFQHIR